MRKSTWRKSSADELWLARLSGWCEQVGFADNSPRQLAAQTLSLAGDPAGGYRGNVVIGIKGSDSARVTSGEPIPI
jgi:hypothetical protein